MKRIVKAFTLMELLVVVLILGLLATIVVGVYTTQVERARIAATRATISSIEVALERYQIDLGVYPPSGSLLGAPFGQFDGCGLMQYALMHSIGGSTTVPSSPLWHGPYLTVKKQLLGDINGVPLEELSASSISPQNVQILDPWHQPYRYVRYGPSLDSRQDDYTNNEATKLPTNHPFAATETWYNPSTFQIVSKGINGITLSTPNYGLDSDDVTNFGQ